MKLQGDGEPIRGWTITKDGAAQTLVFQADTETGVLRLASVHWSTQEPVRDGNSPWTVAGLPVETFEVTGTVVTCERDPSVAAEVATAPFPAAPALAAQLGGALAPLRGSHEAPAAAPSVAGAGARDPSGAAEVAPAPFPAVPALPAQLGGGLAPAHAPDETGPLSSSVAAARECGPECDCGYCWAAVNFAKAAPLPAASARERVAALFEAG